MFSPDRFVPLRRQERQIEPLSHFLGLPPEPFVGAAVLLAIFAQAGRPEFGDSGHMDKKIDCKIAVFRPGKFISDVPSYAQLVGFSALVPDSKQSPQFVDQSPPSRIPDYVRSRIQSGEVWCHYARGTSVGRLIKDERMVSHYFNDEKGLPRTGGG